MHHRFLTVQNKIIQMLESFEDKTKFLIDSWTREPKNLNLNNKLQGHGRTCVLANSQYFDQAGVNFSQVQGAELPPSATQNRPELAGQKFEAIGVSVVVHPKNPYVPTSHFNVRLFQSESGVWWVGGGFDLTPYYGFQEDCVTWHEHAREAVGEDLYLRFKKNCDQYFYLKHRQEPRGIGGLFFDDFNQGSLEECLKLLESVTEHYVQALKIIISRRKDIPYTQREIDFQRYRRGRYVEFNLIYDRGTLFGLQSGGRTESILMSLPPEVSFRYNWTPEENSPEAKLYQEFLIEKDWLAKQTQ